MCSLSLVFVPVVVIVLCLHLCYNCCDLTKSIFCHLTETPMTMNRCIYQLIYQYHFDHHHTAQFKPSIKMSNILLAKSHLYKDISAIIMHFIQRNESSPCFMCKVTTQWCTKLKLFSSGDWVSTTATLMEMIFPKQTGAVWGITCYGVLL